MTVVDPPNIRRYERLLPGERPVRFLEPDGKPSESCDGADRYSLPDRDRLVDMYRGMVLGRRFDRQATALTKQGRLAVYPSSRGQEACQIAAALCLRSSDWLFPTYRDAVALTARGVDPVEVLTLLAGDWHCGYDPVATRCAPQCTPLATQLLHAAGLAYGEARQGRDTVALALCGDGATSEGDFHEALNFAAVFGAPVVFLVQNNGFAISVPLARQSVAPSLAHKGIGYGIAGEQVDGNDPIAMLAVLDEAVRYARAGRGPYLIEAHTYRIDAHTNADDATRYRAEDEVREWLARDPLSRLETYLRELGAIDDDFVSAVAATAEDEAATLRRRMNVDRPADPDELFRHVFAEPTPQLREQLTQMRAEQAAQTPED
ncbi:pyruvate dehydrogenase (acetyl-transferring) E1 component subunit alpha [Nocardia sp. NEAU-G5]|uniref:Pyruvate dehydrogenase (Acetyl-transferring) E1 component subunit alpha n=1 Tax=Nocardia albiluteola TaxID=2842303 RepID=A0ABS6AWL7_9NOCA|nr:pyruvate dehydrogenase (acetyl-transferring) E1 component subunit alpha [Nocardia albiluteola]MBU3062288.1 pyruvate dehydrogenase (acetyl-transferring) E1 component subunit alpha [Nocardia albiluteola]